MKNTSGAEWVGVIPPEAVTGKSLQYYLEARDARGRAVANSGSGPSPYVIVISDTAAPPDERARGRRRGSAHEGAAGQAAQGRGAQVDARPPVHLRDAGVRLRRRAGGQPHRGRLAVPDPGRAHEHLHPAARRGDGRCGGAVPPGGRARLPHHAQAVAVGARPLPVGHRRQRADGAGADGQRRHHQGVRRGRGVGARALPLPRGALPPVRARRHRRRRDPPRARHLVGRVGRRTRSSTSSRPTRGTAGRSPP